MEYRLISKVKPDEGDEWEDRATGILKAELARRKINYVKLSELLNESYGICLLYTSPSPRDRQKSRMPSSA